MRIIMTLRDIEVLEEARATEPEYTEYVREYFLAVCRNLGKGSNSEAYRLDEEGFIVMLEKGDNLRDLSAVGLNPGEGLPGATPEWVEEVIIGARKVYLIQILYNNECLTTFFLPEDAIRGDHEIESWLENNKCPCPQQCETAGAFSF